MTEHRRPPSAALDAIRDPLVVVDDEDRLIRWNEAAERTVSRETLLGSHLPSLVVEGDAEAVRQAAETARWVGEAEATADVRTDDGRRIPHEFRFRRLSTDDAPAERVVVVGRDVSERTRRRERLAVLTRVLRHDARNRLATIRGYVTEAMEALEAGADGEPVDPAAVAEDLAVAADAAAALTDAIDRTYAIQRHVLDDDPKPVRVRIVVDRVVTAFGDEHPAATVDTTVDPPSLRAATGRALGVALEELVENALRHAGPEPNVEIAATAAGETVRVRVSDDGPGIPATDLKSIRTGEVTPLGHASGTGLWIVRWAIRSVGGAVEFDGEDGTTVALIVPRVRSDRAGGAVS